MKTRHRENRGMTPREDWLLFQLKVKRLRSPKEDFDVAAAVVEGTWPSDRRDTGKTPDYSI